MSGPLHELLPRLLGVVLGAAVAASFLLAGRAAMRRVFREATHTRRLLGEGLVALWLASLVSTALLELRFFHRGAVAACAALLALAAISALGGPAAVAATLRADARFLHRLARLLATRPAARAVAATTAILAVPVLLRPLLAPPLGWDTQTYHAVKAALWAKAGAWVDLLGPGPWSVYSLRPAGGSLLAALGIVTVGDDLGMTAFESATWLFLALAFLVAARALGVREPWGSAAALFFCALPTVRLLVGSGYAEPLLSALLLAALAFVRDARPERRRRRPDAIVLAGAALGLAIAVKPNVLPAAPLVLGTTAAAVLCSRGRSRGLAMTALASLALLATIAPWFHRTYRQTGLPLSPLDVKVGPIVLGRPGPEAVWYTQRPDYRHLDASAELRGLALVFGSPLARNEALSWLALAPFGVALARLGRWRLVGWPFPAAGALGVSCLVWYYSPAFAIVRQTGWAASSSRFLLPLVAVALLGSVLDRPRPRRFHPWLAFLAATPLLFLLLLSFHGCGEVELTALLGLSALLAAGGAAWLSLRSRPWRVAGAGLSALTLLAALALRPALRWDIAAEGYQIHTFPSYWMPAARRADGPAPQRIAITSGPWQNVDNWFSYLFLGSRLQNEVLYVPTTRDGAIVPWSAASLAEEAGRAHLQSWLDRLQRQRVDLVMAFTPPSIELSWMERRPDLFERLEGSRGRWGLYLVKRPR